MKAPAFSLFAALCLLGSLGRGAELPVWKRGDLSARLVGAGYVQESKSGAWEAAVALRFANLSASRRFHRAVQVQFLDGKGKVVGTWKTFLSLPAGQAQHRQVRAPSRLACLGELAACPALSVRVLLGNKVEGELAPLPASALLDADVPAEGTALYVAQVYDGDTLQLLGGQKIRLLGIDAPERKRQSGSGAEPYYKEAGEFLRRKVMDAPIYLSYDGEKRDIYGRFLARVGLEDGSDLNLEMLKAGLARVYPRSDFSKKEDYLAAESAAREAGLGLWAKP